MSEMAYRMLATRASEMYSKDVEDFERNFCSLIGSFPIRLQETLSFHDFNYLWNIFLKGIRSEIVYFKDFYEFKNEIIKILHSVDFSELGSNPSDEFLNKQFIIEVRKLLV